MRSRTTSHGAGRPRLALPDQGPVNERAEFYFGLELLAWFYSSSRGSFPGRQLSFFSAQKRTIRCTKRAIHRVSQANWRRCLAHMACGEASVVPNACDAGACRWRHGVNHGQECGDQCCGNLSRMCQADGQRLTARPMRFLRERMVGQAPCRGLPVPGSVPVLSRVWRRLRSLLAVPVPFRSARLHRRSETRHSPSDAER